MLLLNNGVRKGERMKIRFLTANKFKIQEAQEILQSHSIEVIAYSEKIEELQTTDTERMVKDKVLRAFKIIGRPVFVEHTGLYLEYLNELPGGLTQIFWDSLEADKFSELFGGTTNPKASAKTIIGYCNGKVINYFYGEIKGKIAKEPKGSREFQWDCVFIPDGFNQTFAELGDQKNQISMRRRALDEFSDFLKGTIK